MSRISYLVLLVVLSMGTACTTRGLRIGGDSGVVTDTGVAVDMTTPVVDANLPDSTIVYAHSAHTLYALDPRTNALTSIGDFTFADHSATPAMNDLAVNQAGIIYACSGTAIYTVNPDTVITTQLGTLSLPSGVTFNGLTFVPVGVLDPSSEVLVGAAGDGSYYRINPTTGNSTLVGHYSGGYVSSGDIVSVNGAGTFATVRMSSSDTEDRLVLLNPATGQTTLVGSGIGFRGVYGLGYWRARLFGFTSTGQLIQIDVSTGVGTLVADPASTGTDQFYGAGVTTLAPILF